MFTDYIRADSKIFAKSIGMPLQKGRDTYANLFGFESWKKLVRSQPDKISLRPSIAELINVFPNFDGGSGWGHASDILSWLSCSPFSKQASEYREFLIQHGMESDIALIETKKVITYLTRFSGKLDIKLYDSIEACLANASVLTIKCPEFSCLLALCSVKAINNIDTLDIWKGRYISLNDIIMACILCKEDCDTSYYDVVEACSNERGFINAVTYEYYSGEYYSGREKTQLPDELKNNIFQQLRYLSPLSEHTIQKMLSSAYWHTFYLDLLDRDVPSANAEIKELKEYLHIYKKQLNFLLMQGNPTMTCQDETVDCSALFPPWLCYNFA